MKNSIFEAEAPEKAREGVNLAGVNYHNPSTLAALVPEILAQKKVCLGKEFFPNYGRPEQQPGNELHDSQVYASTLHNAVILSTWPSYRKGLSHAQVEEAAQLIYRQVPPPLRKPVDQAIARHIVSAGASDYMDGFAAPFDMAQAQMARRHVENLGIDTSEKSGLGEALKDCVRQLAATEDGKDRQAELFFSR